MLLAPPLQEARRPRRLSWFAKTEPETARPLPTCGTDGSSGLTAFDLYCSGADEHFLPFAESRFVQHVVLNTYRVVLGVAVLLAARYDTSVPMYAAAWLLGLPLLVLPLRAYVISRSVVFVLWVASLGLGAADYSGAMGDEAQRVLLTIAAVLLVVSLLATVAVDPSPAAGKAGDSSGDWAVRATALGLAAGALLLLARGLVMTSLVEDRVVRVSGSLKTVVFVLGLTSVSGSIAVAVAAGFLRGALSADRTVERLFKDPPSVRARKLAPPAGPQRFPRRSSHWADHLVYVINVTAAVLAQRVTDIANALLWAMNRTILAIKISLRWLVEYVHRVAVIVRCAIVLAMQSAFDVVRRAAVGLISPARRHLRSTIAPVAVIALVACLAVYAAHEFTIYLAKGGLVHGIVALLVAVCSAALIPISWWASTGRPGREAREAALRLLSRMGPTAYLLVIALAWADGLLGWIGIGPIRPGWLTYAGTASLVVAYLWARRGEDVPKRTASPT